MQIGRLVPVFVAARHQSPSGGEFGAWEMVAGEPTGTPGLVVTPEVTISGAHYTGRWRITHAASGKAVGPAYATPTAARALAERLARVPLAWNSVGWPLTGASDGLRAEVELALSEPQTAAP